MRAVILAGALAAAGWVGAARADVITTYTASGVQFSDGGSLTGSFQVDQTTYDQANNQGFVGGSLTVTGGTNGFAGIYSFNQFDINNLIVFSSLGGILDIFGVPNIKNGSIIDVSEQSSNKSAFLAHGSILASTPIDAVPEPAAFALLGVGMAGLAAVRRRRGAI